MWRWHSGVVAPIETERLMLRPIFRPVARMLLDGGTPRGLSFAPGYPSEFSLDVMESVVEAAEPDRFGPYFMTRKVDGLIIGEIGCRLDAASAIGKVGYTVVQPCWGQGYATEALRALLARVLTEPDISRVLAETMESNLASRRVMEKAGMSFCGQRVDDEYGEPADLVVYEAVADSRAGALTR